MSSSSAPSIRRQTKTDPSDAPPPLPELCVTALKLRKQQQDVDREHAGKTWTDTGLVLTTRCGTPIEPRNFNRSFDRPAHGTRETCGSLLATLM